MKKQIVVTIIVSAFMMPMAHARLAESADSANSSYIAQIGSAWDRFKQKAEEKVNELVSYFTDKSTEKSTDTRLPASVAQTPEATKPTDTNATATTVTPQTAPMVQPVSEEQQQMKELVQQTATAVKDKPMIVEESAGRAGTSTLPQTKSGVPKFAFSQTGTKGKMSVKEIPRLDIGLERSIRRADLVPPSVTVGARKVAKAKELDSPSKFSQSKIEALKKKPIPLVAKAQPPKNGSVELGSIVTTQKIESIPLAMVPTRPLTDLLPVQEISADDLQLIAALILFERGDKCHLVSGLLTDLYTKKKYSEESNFYLGVCAHKMGFNSEAVTRLLDVVRAENPDFVVDAINNLVEDPPREYHTAIADALNGLKNSKWITEVAKDNADYVRAQAAHHRDRYEEASRFAEMVSEKSKHYAQARYLYAIGLYARGKVKEAEQGLLALREWMGKKGQSNKELEALIAVNVARIRFTQGRYQAANEEYLRVPKDHPLWVQALIEQGWTQLNLADAPGAIGNMYSLHSPYFKSVFMPESWVVRTIGYIDICQYGDAYKTLSKMELLHSNWLTQVQNYVSTKKKPLDYYNTVKTYIKGKSDSSVDGLPSQIIREIARQKGFLNVQDSLNDLEDELGQYGFVYGLIKKDQADLASRLAKTKIRLAKVNADLLKSKTQADLLKFVNEWNAQRRNEDQLVRTYTHMTQVYEEARLGYVKMRANSLARIGQQKSRLQNNAGQELMAHLKDVRSRIEQIFEGNEFLRYEIFSGSGENIRYQVAGGTTSDSKRIPANIKPQKMLNWEFDGEYWEDEIGSYRSTLKDNCPKNTKVGMADGGDRATASNSHGN